MTVTKQGSETQRKGVGNITVAWETLATFQTWKEFGQSISNGFMPGKSQDLTPGQKLAVTSALLSSLFLSLLRQFKCHYCIFFLSISMHTV